MGIAMRQTTRNIRIEASSAQQLQSRAPNITLLPGSTGRLEIEAKRVLGVCPLPLGPLMSAPGEGSIWANSLAPAGATVTSRGGIGICDAFVEFAVPVSQGLRGSFAPMGIGPVALVLVVGAIAGALAILAWSITKLILSITAFVEEVGPVVASAIAIGLVGVVLIGLGVFRRRG